MRQVVIIHGGDTFRGYSAYLRSLRRQQIGPPNQRGRSNWKTTLDRALGRSWHVLRPQMPNKANAHYREWVIWFDKYRPYIQSGAIFVGHSLGGVFLAKYFSQHTWPKKIGAVILVASPHPRNRALGDFHYDRALTAFAKHVPRIFILHSTDDRIVSMTEGERYATSLPKANFRRFSKRGHFNGTQFPELVHLIKTLRR